MISSLIGNSSGGNTDTANWNQMRMNDVAWERQMNASNTAHQREVKDLVAAGLNPTLSAGGNGSSSPSASSGTPQVHPRIVQPDVLGAMSLFQKQQEIQNQTDLKDEAIAKSKADRGLTAKKTENEGKGVLKTLDQLGGDLLRNLRKQLKPNQYYKPPGNMPGPDLGPLINGANQ